MVIYKFPVLAENSYSVPLPKGARVLSVHVQHGDPQMWVLLNPDMPKEAVRFHVYGTGHEIDDVDVDRLVFVGTFQLHGGSLVFHLFREERS